MASPSSPRPEDDVFGDDDDGLLAAAAADAAPSSSSALTTSQKARAEKNRLKAKTLKQSRLLSRPYPAGGAGGSGRAITGEKLPPPRKQDKEKKLKDSGAGFFIEEEDDDDGAEEKQVRLSELPAPILEPDRPQCDECAEDVADSYLLRTFDLSVCDKCRDTEKDGKHELITKTEAKSTFLLKDGDLDRREPVLKFIIRKNPHNPRWGDMKLFLRAQVEERAIEVWGSEESLEKEHALREEKKDKAKAKKFNKQIKALRMQVRGSLYKKETKAHEHEFGEEEYDEEEDEYVRQCKTCDYAHRYEKM